MLLDPNPRLEIETLYLCTINLESSPINVRNQALSPQSHTLNPKP